MQWLGAAVFLATSNFASTAKAGELAYAIGYIGEHSDNIQRSSSSPRSEMINSAIAGVDYRENGPALDAHVQATAEYRDFRNNVYNDGPLYYSDASLLWKISPQQLHWTFVDRYDQVTRDATLPGTPSNMISSNVLSTGPDLYARLGSVNTLALELRYGEATYGEGDYNNNRHGGAVRWQYTATTQLKYSLNYEIVNIKYDNPILNDNLERHDLYMRADLRDARMRFLLDLGGTHIYRERAGETSGYIARLTWSQQLTSGSTAGILAASEYLDAGTVLLSTATSPVPVTGAPPGSTFTSEVTNDFFYMKRAEAYYARSDSSTELNARIFYRDINYEVAPLDRQETGGLLEVTYKATSLLSTSVYGGYVSAQYQNISRDDRVSELGVRLLYRLSRNLSAALDGRKTRRYSSDLSQEFTDNRALFSLIYSSSPLFTPHKEMTGGHVS